MAIVFTVKPRGGGTQIEGIKIPSAKTWQEAVKAAPRLGKTQADVVAAAMGSLVVPAQNHVRTRKTWPASTSAAQAVVNKWLKAEKPKSTREQIEAIKASDDSPEVKLAKLLEVVG